MLQQISPKAGLSLANALQHERTAASAATDELTGLPNNRSLTLHLNGRLKASAAVLVLDLDGFKGVNDRFGHLTGNRVLRLVSEALRKVFLGEDYIARMGGDEFVVVMQDGAQAISAVNRLDLLVRKIGQQVCGTEDLALSAGVAYYPGDGDSAEKLMSVADQRMYAVKEEHRVGTPKSFVA